jgi:GNAT superfamily N-acetyltransferase
MATSSIEQEKTIEFILEKHFGYIIGRPDVFTDWLYDVNPELYVKSLIGKVDVFTFWNRVPNKAALTVNGKVELDNIAALPITSVDYWRNVQVSRKVRNIIRKAVKNSVVVRHGSLCEEYYEELYSLFHGIIARQNKPFTHRHESLEQIKSGFEKLSNHRFEILNAYHNEKLIGTLGLLYSEETSLIGNFTVADEYQKLGVPSLLIEKAVERTVNAKKKLLIYTHWKTDKEASNDSLRDFKRHCGFQEMKVARYYVPLTFKGKVVIFLGLHKGKWGLMPQFLKDIILSGTGLKLIQSVKRQGK